MRLGQRDLFKNQICIIDTTTGNVVDRYYVSSPLDVPRQCTANETVTYVTSWWHLFWGSIITYISKRSRQPQSKSKSGELWDNRKCTRVADIIQRPYVATSIDLELHVHNNHMVLYRVVPIGKIQVPLRSLDACLSALVKSKLPKQEVIDKIKGQPYEL